MNDFEITSAQYIQDDNVNTSIKMIVPNMPTGVDYHIVPISVGNKEYDEIMRQVAAGTLTIEDAD